MTEIGIKEFKDGWIIGNFEPSIINTKDFEVAVKHHYQSDVYEKHIHKVAREINYIIFGKVALGKNENIWLRGGAYWIVEPNEYVEVRFLEPTTLLVIKVPSAPNDKYPIESERSEQ